MSICKWSQKVCQELLKIFEDHYLDRNFFLRPDYADYCRSRGRGRGRTWGCAAPYCVMNLERGHKPCFPVVLSGSTSCLSFPRGKAEKERGHLYLSKSFWCKREWGEDCGPLPPYCGDRWAVLPQFAEYLYH